MADNKAFLEKYESILHDMDKKLVDVTDMTLLFEPTIQIFDHDTPLSKVLEHMATACVVYYSDGIPDHWNRVARPSQEEERFNFFYKHYQFINSCDVVTFLMSKCKLTSSGADSNDISNHNLSEVLSVPIGKIANISQKYTYKCIDDQVTLSSLFQIVQSHYYIPMLSSIQANKLCGVLTIPKLLKYIHSSSTCASMLPLPSGDLQSKEEKKYDDSYTIERIKRADGKGKNHKMWTCHEKTPLFEALLSIQHHKISALTVLNSNEPSECITIFSVTDLRLFLLHLHNTITGDIKLSSLNVPIIDILSGIYQLHSLKARHPMIHMKKTCPIDITLNKMLTVNIRHLLVTDANDKVIDVLTLRDIAVYLTRLLTQAYKSNLFLKHGF